MTFLLVSSVLVHGGPARPPELIGPTVKRLDAATARPLSGDDPRDRELLDRWVAAFERYDMTALAALLQADVVQSMPPYALSLQGADVLPQWFAGPGAGCRGSRVVPVEVNGSPGYAQYRDGGRTPWGITALQVRDGRFAELTTFLETDGSLFALFGLPPQLTPPIPSGDVAQFSVGSGG
jgi:RNA polymerase sigma-70 factor (ECF subfamily)